MNTANLEKKLRLLKTEKEVNELVAEKNLPMREVISCSHINKNYVYNITNGTKQNPGRDKIIALCIGAHMSYEETNKGLEIGGYCGLRPQNERDVRVAGSINMGIYDVLKINIILEEYGLNPLDV